MLLAAKADASVCTSEGSSPLHYACAGAHGELALALVRAGATVSDTRGGNSLAELNGGVATQVKELVKELSGGGDEEEDEEEGEEGGGGRPVTAP